MFPDAENVTIEMDPTDADWAKSAMDRAYRLGGALTGLRWAKQQRDLADRLRKSCPQQASVLDATATAMQAEAERVLIDLNQESLNPIQGTRVQ